MRRGEGRDGVLIVSLRTKMNAIGPGVTAGLQGAVELAEREYQGLVIWSPGSLDGGPFSAGADLQAMLPLFMSGGAKAIGPEEKKLQDAMLALRYAQVPTVAAVAGLALGGGCELAVHCARRVAHLESYIGLVEVGVGLIPGGGGLAYGARRAAEEQRGRARGLPAALPGQVLHGRGHGGGLEVGASKRGAWATCWRRTPIVFNIHELLHVAIRQAKAMHAAYWRPPLRAPIKVAGRGGRATIEAQLVNMRDGGFISAHDFHLGQHDRRRHVRRRCRRRRWSTRTGCSRSSAKASCRCSEHPKTQERIMGMMQTGKPVRN